MSTEEFNKKNQETKKLINAIRKDLRFRSEQENRGETTHSLDAEIRGQFNDLEDAMKILFNILNTTKANPKDYGLNNKEIDRREKICEQAKSDSNSLKRTYDSFFQKKTNNNQLIRQNENFHKANNTANMTSKQLAELKAKQEAEQDQAIDGLIDTVKNIKGGAHKMHDELNEQEQMLKALNSGVDNNMQKMGKVRRGMMKLLEESSNCCLISIIILEIAAIICIAIFWT